MELQLHSPIHLHGAMLNLSTGTTLLFYLFDWHLKKNYLQKLDGVYK
jgi:hypothetical protein